MGTNSPYWNPRTETFGRGELAALQLARLRALCERAIAGSPRHARSFASAGFVPEQLRNIGDLQRVPLDSLAEWAAVPWTDGRSPRS